MPTRPSTMKEAEIITTQVIDNLEDTILKIVLQMPRGNIGCFLFFFISTMIKHKYPTWAAFQSDQQNQHWYQNQLEHL